ncbi:MAG: hypothetical protein IJ108_06110 [Eubacterium sp.]|nr:hypothetical protein [Eubacterium sp.]
MKSRMKKSLCLLGAVMIGAAIVFSGCGSSAGGGNGSAAAEKASPESEVTAVVDGFFTTMQSGELSKLTDYCSQEVLDNQELAGLAEAESFDEMFYESFGLEDMGLSEDDISDEAKASVTNMANTIVRELIGSYTISDVSVNGDTATVDGTVTYGYNTDFDIDIDGINDEVMSDIPEDQMSEYADVYMNEGEAAMMAKIMNDLMPTLLDRYTEALLESEGETDQIQATVTKTDGKWLITEMNLISASETGDSE